ncbi:MAG TPA: MmgE/PrpD family protein [Burkholderiales bacterium]|nr:MmgE/PrpD family protein [Burkholderiales bacterium]
MQRLCAYIAGALRKPLPAAVAEKTRHHLLDTLAAMVSGSRLRPGKAAISFARAQGGAKEACVAGSRVVTAAANAALANGMLAHADETDDSHSRSQTHPGCGVVAAALAMAERERAGGAALLRAVALGYDVCCRLTQSLDAAKFRAAGHSTHTFGPTFGAAAAAGALAGLDARRVRYLLSYAAQQASGISCWMRDEEHIEKAFDFGGMPARNGVAAAAMVAHGFTGLEDVFSGERNFFVAYGDPPDPEELARDLGERYEILHADIKRWAVGSPIQAPLDSLLELIREHKVRADEVERVVVRVAHQGANTTDNREMPDICMQHLCAVMLLDGTVSFGSSHDRARMRHPRVLELRRRVELKGDDALSRAMPRREGIAEIRLKDGRGIAHHTRAVRGTPENPMSRAEVEAKALDLLAPVLGRARAAKLCAAVRNVEKIRDARALRALLRA